jgi:hypothetical protein
VIDMSETEALRRFIRSAFGSVWSLELLLVLRGDPRHGWTRAELIRTLRASEQVLTRSTADLEAAGLIALDGDGRARFAPASPELEATVAKVADLYASRPGTVRRWIVGGDPDPVERFADAFRFRKDRGE